MPMAGAVASPARHANPRRRLACLASLASLALGIAYCYIVALQRLVQGPSDDVARASPSNRALPPHLTVMPMEQQTPVHGSRLFFSPLELGRSLYTRHHSVSFVCFSRFVFALHFFYSFAYDRREMSAVILPLPRNRDRSRPMESKFTHDFVV